MSEMLLVLQTVLLVPFLVSVAFRIKGNYLVHGIIMIVLVVAGWFATIASLPNFMDNSFMEPYMSPSSTLVVSGLHIFFGVATYFLEHGSLHFGVLGQPTLQLRAREFGR